MHPQTLARSILVERLLGGPGSGIKGHTTPHDKAVAAHDKAVKAHEGLVKLHNIPDAALGASVKSDIAGGQDIEWEGYKRSEVKHVVKSANDFADKIMGGPSEFDKGRSPKDPTELSGHYVSSLHDKKTDEEVGKAFKEHMTHELASATGPKAAALKHLVDDFVAIHASSTRHASNPEGINQYTGRPSTDVQKANAVAATARADAATKRAETYDTLFHHRRAFDSHASASVANTTAGNLKAIDHHDKQAKYHDAQVVRLNNDLRGASNPEGINQYTKGGAGPKDGKASSAHLKSILDPTGGYTRYAPTNTYGGVDHATSYKARGKDTREEVKKALSKAGFTITPKTKGMDEVEHPVHGSGYVSLTHHRDGTVTTDAFIRHGYDKDPLAKPRGAGMHPRTAARAELAEQLEEAEERTLGGAGSGWFTEGGHVPGAGAGVGGKMPFESAYQKRMSVPTAKDTKRITDIVKKGGGLTPKAHDLARQMANAIKDPQKAKRRGRAADALGHSSLGTIFHDRHTQLAKG